MYNQSIRELLLVMHLSGLALMAGTTVTGFATFYAFINRFKIKSEGSSDLLKLQSNLGHILGLGGTLLILSGIGLIIMTGGVFLHMLWLQLKFFLILLLLINDKVIGNSLFKKLKVNFIENNPASIRVINTTIPKITLYYIVQLSLFLGIIIMAVFKFN